MATAQTTKNAITLKGSATIISEYLSKCSLIELEYFLIILFPLIISDHFQTMVSIRYCSNVEFIQLKHSKAINITV